MTIIKVIGGLGNQMFQFALFLIMKDKGLDVKLDISEFKTYTLHNGFELSNVFCFDTSDMLANETQIAELKDLKSNFKIRKLIGKLIFRNTNIFVKNTHFLEPNFSKFIPEIWEMKNKFLEGYWQNEKYFIDAQKTVREIYTWKNISQKNEQYATQMQDENAVALHIRRLDRPKNFKEILYRIRLSFVWRICKKSYYLKAIQRIRNEVKNPKFYIFTDNLTWVRKNIIMTDDFEFIDWNRGHDSNQDMYLMSKCKHNIISMSSFSWWGAWLNNNPNKIVIAPKKWAVRFTKDYGVIPKKWIRI